MVPRDKTGLALRAGDQVRVQVGDGPECLAVIGSTHSHSPSLSGCALVEFDNGTAQWMDGKYLTIITPEVTSCLAPIVTTPC